MAGRPNMFDVVITGTDARAAVEAQGREAALNLRRARADRWCLEVRGWGGEVMVVVVGMSQGG